MSLSVPARHPERLSRRDFERLSALPLSQLYNEIGQGVSFQLNVEPIYVTRGRKSIGYPPRVRIRPPSGYKGAEALHFRKVSFASSGKKFVARKERALKRKICRDWNYCERRDQYDTAANLAVIITPIVTPILSVPAWVAARVVMVLVKSGLDKFCGCSKGKKKKSKKD